MLAYSAKSSVTSFYYSFFYPYLICDNIPDKDYPISLKMCISFKENCQNCHMLSIQSTRKTALYC